MKENGGKTRHGAWEATTGFREKKGGRSRRFSRGNGDRAEEKGSVLSSTTTDAD